MISLLSVLPYDCKLFYILYLVFIFLNLITYLL